MKTKITIISIIILFFVGVNKIHAQGFTLKTNLAGWTMLAPNIGADLCLNESTSFEVIFYQSAVNSWFKDLNFSALQLGYRYWFDRQPLNSFFFGLTATPTLYNIKLKDSKRKGECIPFGFNIGYCIPLSEKMNLEFSYGVGATYLFEEIKHNNTELRDFSRHKLNLSPTNLELSISYIIK